MKQLFVIIYCALFTSCEMVDYHPYDVNISGECGVNNKNISIIESLCINKDTIRVIFTGDTQGWFDDTKDMVRSINNQKKIDFVIHGGDVTDFGITKEKILLVNISTEGEFFGNYFYVLDKNTLLIYSEGVFFEAKRE